MREHLQVDEKEILCPRAEEHLPAPPAPRGALPTPWVHPAQNRQLDRTVKEARLPEKDGGQGSSLTWL